MNYYAAHQTTAGRISFVLACTALALSACTVPSDTGPTEEPDDAGPSTSTGPTLIPEQIEDPEEAAIAAYTRYWETLSASAAAPDGDYSEFETISADQALEYATSIESDAFANGTRMTGAISHSPSVKDSIVTDEVTQVVVVDCADSSDLETIDRDDATVAGESYGPQEVQARVELLGGMWVVTVLAIQEVGSCVPDD